jgi:hypothetical protein
VSMTSNLRPSFLARPAARDVLLWVPGPQAPKAFHCLPSTSMRSKRVAGPSPGTIPLPRASQLETKRLNIPDSKSVDRGGTGSLGPHSSRTSASTQNNLQLYPHSTPTFVKVTQFQHLGSCRSPVSPLKMAARGRREGGRVVVVNDFPLCAVARFQRWLGKEEGGPSASPPFTRSRLLLRPLPAPPPPAASHSASLVASQSSPARIRLRERKRRSLSGLAARRAGVPQERSRRW